ncbi:SdrD B-like domain-containing protein [Frigoriglobus tundricola]|uniref:SD-repeat containing protein B domain-containing protein n=1 Tax=Frigoriglobus tundricola TaxID=2774151 RepID=A0A6M5YGV0_9BACT|nr:SdrD B-like domain-containing protein [Frigoriglobus tundricola]QJW93218.1 hypothetical protein FTUN_0723 [Frigoriglobus tundricola]
MLNSGTDTIQFTAPAGYLIDGPSATWTGQVTVQAGQTLQEDVPAYSATASTAISGIVQVDMNGETPNVGLPGVTVAVLGQSASATTDANGMFTVGNLLSGTYQLQLTAPTGYRFESSNLSTLTVSASAPGQNNSVYVLAYQPGVVSGTAFVDTNADRQEGNGESGLAGVGVTLIGSNGQTVATTNTGSTGNYSFSGLAPGDYTVAFVAPTGYVLSGTSRSTQQSVPLGSGQTQIVNAPAYTHSQAATVSGTVWKDTNGDGLAGASVALLDANGNSVATITTGSAGTYSVTGLAPGTYTLGFTVPAGYVLNGSSSGLSESLTLGAGETIEADAQAYPVAQSSTVSGTVTLDKNGNGIADVGETGLAGVTVSLLDSNGNPMTGSGGAPITTTTDSTGAYAFSNLAPGSYGVQFSAPASYVMSDSGQSSWSGSVNTPGPNSTLNALAFQPITVSGTAFLDSNGDKVRDNGETALAGVHVSVIDQNGNTIATATTAADGSYAISGLAPGEDEIEFTAPNGDVVSGTSASSWWEQLALNSGVNVTAGAGGYEPGTASGGSSTTNPAALYAIPGQANAEGEAVSLQLTLLNNTTGQIPTYTVTGLPPGLSLSPTTTGMITGTPFYSDAQTNGGVYLVTVTDTVGGSSGSMSFNWSITDTNRLGQIDDVLSKTDASGNITLLSGGSIQATDLLGDALTFTISGLPGATISGTQISPGVWLAAISGHIPDATATYTVTVSVTGGGATDTRTFNWTNESSGAAAAIQPEVNDTLSTSDDFSEVGTAIDVGYLITGPDALTGGIVTFSIASGPGQISGPTTVTFGPSSSGVVYVGTSVTPTGVTPTADGIQVNAVLVDGNNPPKDLPVAKVYGVELWLRSVAGGRVMPIGHVVGNQTPPGMTQDRIPPRVNTSVRLYLSGWLPQFTGIAWQIINQSDLNGRVVSVDDNGAKSATDAPIKIPAISWIPAPIGATYTSYAALTLQGSMQTAPPAGNQAAGVNAGQLDLRLVNSFKPAEKLYDSAGFSVAAVPVGVTMLKGVAQAPGVIDKGNGKYAVSIAQQYGFTIKSDSGDMTDLTQVSVKEIVTDGQATGIMKGQEKGNSTPDYLPPLGVLLNDGTPMVDNVGLSWVTVTATSVAQAAVLGTKEYFDALNTLSNGKSGSTGTLVNNQYFMFKDARTGATDIKIDKSGFKHSVTVTMTDANTFTITVAKTPGANNDVGAGTENDTTQKPVELTVKNPG